MKREAASNAPVYAVACMLFVGLFAARSADACTCVMSPDNCAGIGTADAVFEATVEAIELAPRSASLPVAVPAGASASIIGNALRVITLREVRRWLGESQPTVVTDADGAACGYEFRTGTRYLIVAHRLPDGRLSVSRCGLTRPLAEASGWLDYLRILSGPAAQTRVWGQVMMPVRWADFGRDFGPISAARVTVNGPQQRSVMTAADGRYSFADLPHGSYTVSVDLPSALPQLGKIDQVALTLNKAQTHACAAADFIAPIKSSISGVIADEAGAPLVGVFVQLALADQLDRSRGAAGAGIETDAKGHYEFHGLPPGRYRVGLNVWGPANLATPYAVAYARTMAGETVISLPFGGAAVLEPLRARRLTQVTVLGIARGVDGNPASAIDITTEQLGEWGRTYASLVKTDAEGRFELRLWQGERYRIRVGASFNPDVEIEFVATDKPISLTLRRR